MKTNTAIKIFSLTALIAIVAACTPPPKDLDKLKAKLEKKRTELDALEAEIEALEIEIADLDTSARTLRTRKVKIDTVERKSFAHYIEVQGNMDSDDNILVSPEMSGVINSVLVKEGDKVGVGTTLATLDASAIQSQLAQVQTAYELAKTTFEKQERLWNQKIGSEIQYLQAKANKESLESQIKTIQAQASMTRIKSPISGTVDAVMVKLGEMANPGMSGVRVVNLDKMKVIARVADQYVNDIKKGDAVIIEIPDLGESYEATISYVGQVINPATRSIDVEVQLNNKERLLKPNMVVKLKIKDMVSEEVIIVPTNIVQNSMDEKFVMVVADEGGSKIARKRVVEAGSDYAGQTVISSGLEPGDVIITFGFQEVVDGQPITF